MTTLARADYGRLQRVALKRPQLAFASQPAIEEQWHQLGFTAAPQFELALAEYDAFEQILRAHDIAIDYLPDTVGTSLDSLYVRDASVLCERGAILCRMGKNARRGEPAAHGELYANLGIPVLGAIEPPGTLEGGDVAWLDRRTIAVGHGYRTNASGIEQLRGLLGNSIDTLIVAQLPHYRGPADVFHLMSILSPLGAQRALVYSPLMPVALRETLLARRCELIEVADDEFETLGCNALALAPATCLLPRGNPQTRARLERAGVEVIEFSAAEISLKGGGGPTCLTRPLEWAV